MNVISKPWGSETLLEVNDKYMFKLLFMKANHRCSLQYHERKLETIFVVEGELRIYTGVSQEELIAKSYFPGDAITLMPGEIHRMEGVTDCKYLEASTPELDDVIRLMDDYNRG